MRLLPYRKFEVRSPLAVEAIVQLLRSSVEPRRALRVGPGQCPFEGTVTDATFDIRRIIAYRNAFLPKIQGTIAPDPPGSRISITMRLHLAALIFMALWLGAVLVMGARLLPAGRADLRSAVVPFGMFLFGWILTAGGFSFEARKAEQVLTALLEGRAATLAGP